MNSYEKQQALMSNRVSKEDREILDKIRLKLSKDVGVDLTLSQAIRMAAVQVLTAKLTESEDE